MAQIQYFSTPLGILVQGPSIPSTRFIVIQFARWSRTKFFHAGCIFMSDSIWIQKILPHHDNAAIASWYGCRSTAIRSRVPAVIPEYFSIWCMYVHYMYVCMYTTHSVYTYMHSVTTEYPTYILVYPTYSVTMYTIPLAGNWCPPPLSVTCIIIVQQS